MALANFIYMTSLTDTHLGSEVNNTALDIEFCSTIFL